MQNIGNYNTTQSEIDIVRYWLNLNGYQNVVKIFKDPNANDSDVIVQFANGTRCSFEVKNEGYNRFNKYHDLGIDYISVCEFKNTTTEGKWKTGIKNPLDHYSFLNDLNITSSNFKWGKLIYSKANIWLFYVSKDGKINNSSITYIEAFCGLGMTSAEFLIYLQSYCKFSVNNKLGNQQSANDTFDSATFFINKDDKFLDRYKF